MQIDIGFSDIITPEPAAIVYPVILGHPSPELHAYNRETVNPEKFEAMVNLMSVTRTFALGFGASRRI